MKLGFLWVGRTREPEFSAAIDRYRKRIERHAEVIVEVAPDAGRRAGRRPEDIARTEGRDLQKMLWKRGQHLGLDPAGTAVDSPGMARILEQALSAGGGHVQFVLGGAAGYDADVRGRMDRLVSLTPLTMTHEMARLLLLEQVYRAFTILRGEPYHK